MTTLSLRQQRISLKLARIDRKAVDVYLGALKVLNDLDNPDRYSQSAHSLREVTLIISRKFNIPRELLKGEENLKTKIEKRFIEKSDLLPLPAEEEAKFLLKKWMEIYDYFLKITHHGEHAVEEEFETKLAEFENILNKFIEAIPVTLDELDKLLSVRSPQQDDMKKLSELLKHPSHVEYFFSRLDSPEWLQPLSSLGFFTKIPETIKEGNYTKFPNWPLSKYLIKISGIKPKEVIGIIKKIPKTDNIGVHLDLINCGLQMPSNLAKEIVPLAKKWIVNPYRTLIPGKIGELIVKFTNDNEVAPALDLLETLLDVKLQDKEEAIFSRESEPLFNSWAYNQILIKVVPLVFAKEPNKVLEILCKKLSKAITLESDEDDIQVDFSRFWRPAIEESSQNFDRGVKNYLLSAIRDNLEKLAVNNDKLFRSCYGTLSKYNFSIFRRIELHLMNKFPDLLKTEIQQVLSEKKIFENSDLYHERYHLLQDQYQKLPEEIKEKILERIEAGPDLVRFESNYKDRTGNPPTEEEKIDYKSRWQMMALYPIRDHIPFNWKEKMDKFLTRYGEMEHPDYLAYHGPVVVGSTSPISEEEFKKKSLKEILDFLRTWKPSKKFFSPTKEALGGIMSKVISDNPKKYVPLSKDVGKLSPVYIYHFLKGYREALKKGNNFDWTKITMLCKEVVVTSENKTGSFEDNLYGLKSVKGAVCDILEEGLRNTESLPIEFRSAILELIRTILKDNEPDQTYETKYVGEHMDPFNLSLNTVRGKAMHALVLYALWCAKYTYSPKAADKMVPEVKELLEMHLNPDYEPTQTVRAVYGFYLPNLFYLNSEWTERQIPKIFPKGAEFRALSRAAWEAYVKYAIFYNDVYSKMKNEYCNAINKLNSPKISQNAKSKLVEHLMFAYLRGLEDLGSDSLISNFFKMKQYQVNGHAIWFIGKVLDNIQKEETDSKVKKRIMERCLNLWKWRIDEARKMDESARKQVAKELKMFGFWFINSPFDKKSAISQLCITVEITEGIMDFATEIIKKLPEYASDYSSEVLRILDLLIRGDQYAMLPMLSKEKISDILEIITTKRPPQEIRVPVNRLVDSLTRRGLHEFRKFFIKE